jgi:hypothetical protein
MEETVNAYRVLAGKPERRRSLGKQGVEWRIILKWLLKEQGASKTSYCRPEARLCRRYRAFGFCKWCGILDRLKC